MSTRRQGSASPSKNRQNVVVTSKAGGGTATKVTIIASGDGTETVEGGRIIHGVIGEDGIPTQMIVPEGEMEGESSGGTHQFIDDGSGQITIVDESGQVKQIHGIVMDDNENTKDSQPDTTEGSSGTGATPVEMETDDEPVWNESGCIVCNVDIALTHSPENISKEKRKLKMFFLEAFAVGDQIHLEEEHIFPFCTKCTEELEHLMSISNKIDFMNKQFNKLRDSIAKRSCNTFLCRTNPKLLEEDMRAEKFPDPDNPTKQSYQDKLFNRWKGRFEMIQPGPKGPMMIRSMDSRGRVTVVRVDSKTQNGNRSLLSNDKGLGGVAGLLSQQKDKDKPYKCEVCGKGFAQRGGLVTHSLVHTGAKPYTCDICTKSFRQKYHLTQHSLIHSGEKPFSCELCGKCFNVKMNLREHMRRHTGDRPYKCPYCTIIGFFRKKMLRDHIVKIHPQRPLPMELASLPTDSGMSEMNDSGEELLDATEFFIQSSESILPDN